MPDTQRLMTDATGQSIASALTNIAAAVKPDATELNMGPSDSTKVATKITEQSQTIGKILPVISGSTNNSGYAISAGEYFEADGALYKATASIPTGNAWSSSATALSDHGAINALNSKITKQTVTISPSSSITWGTNTMMYADKSANVVCVTAVLNVPSGGLSADTVIATVTNASPSHQVWFPIAGADGVVSRGRLINNGNIDIESALTQGFKSLNFSYCI